jgi:DNA-binding beta-propeller fold protein YncE
MIRRFACLTMAMLLTAACASGGGSAGTPVTPQKIAFSGTPNGIAIRDSDGAVFVTDDKTNGIVMTENIADASPDFALFSRIPAAEGERTSLSQIDFAPNGHLMVERFGFGTSSAVFDIAPSRQAALASDTNPSRRRLGIEVLDGGTFLSSWFTKEGNAPATGGVSVITRGATPGSVTERDIVTGLGKPVGVVVVGDTLFISDQALNRIFKVDLQMARAANAPVQATDVFATVESPDLLAASSDGTLYTKCGAHAICSFSKRGRATVLASDFDEPRGIAVDGARKRLVAVDRSSARDQPSALRVLPIR